MENKNEKGMKIVRPTKNLRWSRRVPPSFLCPVQNPKEQPALSILQYRDPLRYGTEIRR